MVLCIVPNAPVQTKANAVAVINLTTSTVKLKPKAWYVINKKQCCVFSVCTSKTFPGMVVLVSILWLLVLGENSTEVSLALFPVLGSVSYVGTQHSAYVYSPNAHRWRKRWNNIIITSCSWHMRKKIWKDLSWLLFADVVWDVHGKMILRACKIAWNRQNKCWTQISRTNLWIWCWNYSGNFVENTYMMKCIHTVKCHCQQSTVRNRGCHAMCKTHLSLLFCFTQGVMFVSLHFRQLINLK